MAKHIVPTSVNASGLEEISAFLAERHVKGADHFTSAMLRAWAADVEFQLAEGNGPTIEIKSWDAVSGRTETYTISPDGIDSVVMLDRYTVCADRATGEWLGEPELLDQVEEREWHASQDTEDTHFDTYEAEDGTRAIEVVWAD